MIAMELGNEMKRIYVLPKDETAQTVAYASFLKPIIYSPLSVY